MAGLEKVILAGNRKEGGLVVGNAEGRRETDEERERKSIHGFCLVFTEYRKGERERK